MAGTRFNFLKAVTQEFRGLAHNLKKYRGRKIGQNFLLPVLTPFQLAQDSLLASMGEFMGKHAFFRG